MTKKYLEYFPGTFDDTVPGKLEMDNFPYVAYSKEEGLVVYTYVLKKMGYTSTDMDIVIPYNSNATIGTNRRVVKNIYSNKGYFYTNGPLLDICANAFRDRTTLKSIKLTEGIARTYDNSFWNCNQLEDIQLPSTLMLIGPATFAYCRALPSIILPKGLLHINDNGFNNTSSLSSIEFPETLITLGNSAFESSGLTALHLPNNIESIGKRCFCNCDKLTEAVIGNGIKLISSSGFENCNVLADVHLSEGLITIGSYAFADCPKLNSVILPESLTTIDDAAFLRCTSLDFHSLHLPSGVVSLSSTAYNYCKNLGRPLEEGTTGTITVDKDNPKYEDRGANAIITKKNQPNPNIIVLGCQSTIIPEEGNDAVTDIGPYAFKGQSNMSSINIHGRIIKIDKGTFEDCSNLLKINSLTDDESVSTLNIPDGVEWIDSRAFYHCDSLGKGKQDKLCIPKSIMYVASDAFSYVNNMYGVYADPDNERYEDRGCNGLFTKADQNVYTPNELVIGCRTTVIPESCTSIGNYAFHGRLSETTLDIPESVISIGTGAFWDADSLVTLRLPSKINYILDNTFLHCGNLNTINWHDRIESIGSQAFKHCSNLKNLLIEGKEGNYLPNSCEVIYLDAFYYCGIEQLTFNDQLKSIGSKSFYGSRLTEVVIPDSVLSIGVEAFRECRALVSATLGSGLTALLGYTFCNCSSLENVTLPKNNSNLSLSYTFYGCEKLQRICIPPSIKTIADYAFAYCGILNSVTFDDLTRIDKIGTCAFYGCRSLREISLPTTVSEISLSAFYRCDMRELDLTSLVGLTKIGPQAFAENTNLLSLKLPASVTSIGDKAFNTGDNVVQTIKIYTSEAPTIGTDVFVPESVIMILPEARSSYYTTKEDGTEELLKSWENYLIVVMDTIDEES